MILDLFQIEETEHKFAVEIAPAAIALEEEGARLEKAVGVAGKLKKGIAQTDVEGEIKGEIEIDCTRCLETIKTPLDLDFKAAYVTEENYTSAKDAELKAGDLEISIFDGDKIDLAELAREQILLNLPTRFLCREDCRGLCPQCGVNRNGDACDCQEKEIDPRFSALRELKIKD